MSLQNIVRYFRDCYEEDNRRSSLWNIFNASVTHRLFAEDQEQLLTGFLAEIPLDPDDGLEAAKSAYLYQKEKELVYSSFFIVGNINTGDEEARAICAPLLIHQAEIVTQSPHCFLKPDLNARRINYHLLNALEGESSARILSMQVADLLNHGPIQTEQVFELSALLERSVTGIDVTMLGEYPKLRSESDLQRLLKVSQQKGGLIAVSSSAAALIKKSAETRGVIDELSQIAEAESFSEPIQVLFGLNKPTPRPVGRLGRVPAVLNGPQQSILERSATRPLTLVIGPPGTGKSFTIAALAVEHLSRGESVLIASKMNHAVDVVADKIEKQMGIENGVIRGGRKQYLSDLKRHLDQLLFGIHSGGPKSAPDAARLDNELSDLDREIAHLERRIGSQNTRELAWGRALSNTRTGILQAIRKSYIEYRVKRSEPLWDLLDRLERLLEQRVDKTIKLLQVLNRQRLSETLKEHRQELNTFLRAIRARTGLKQEDLFSQIDFEVLFGALPIWLVNLADIQEVLPLKRELFDLAIIDEATQCDIASCLPILQRARRVVISGDPNQLRHISFLPRSRQSDFLARHEIPATEGHRLDYREKSILDFVNDALTSQDEVIFLDEHYRSSPPIIQFSNQRFYAGALRVMTEKPGITFRDSLVLSYDNGHRNRSGVNDEEAKRLIGDCLQQIESEKAGGLNHRRSIGILSPFRGQADHIAETLAKELSLEIFEQHDIMIGTAHTFQGEERDIMYITMGVDSSCHPATLRFLERPDVFNVSITRARVSQRIYTSIEAPQLDAGSLLRSYLDYIKVIQMEDPGIEAATHRDQFLNDVEATLRRTGCETLAGYRIAGLSIDLVVSRQGRCCGIDLVGFPGAFETAFPLDRYKMFYRSGLKIVPLPYTLWRTSREDCLEAIDRALQTSAG